MSVIRSRPSAVLAGGREYLLRYDLDTSLQVIHGVGFYDLGVYPRY